MLNVDIVGTMLNSWSMQEHCFLLLKQSALYPAVVARWLERWARNQKVPGSRPATAMSSFGDWFTQP
jgi:hypothetical protein